MKYFLIIFLLAVSSNYLISNNKINIYANDSLVIEEIIISNIKIKGNKKTKKEIILRELDFKVGEKISINKLKIKIYDEKEN